MTDGVDIAFGTGQLRDGAGRATGTADAAAGVVARLAGLTVDAGPFGRVNHAPALADALRAARDGYRALGQQVADAHHELAQRAQHGAQLGDRLVTDTTAAAGPPGSDR